MRSAVSLVMCRMWQEPPEIILIFQLNMMVLMTLIDTTGIRSTDNDLERGLKKLRRCRIVVIGTSS